MAKVDKFEDLECRKAARRLVSLTYSLSESGKFSRDFSLRDQLRRAALSTMNNIAEGFGRKSAREFVRFLDITQSSAVEVKSMTYVLEDLQYIDTKDLSSLVSKAEETKNKTRGLIKYLKSVNNL